MSYDIYAGKSGGIHFTWNYNEKIIFPYLEDGLRSLDGKTSREAGEAIAHILEELHKELRRFNSTVSVTTQQPVPHPIRFERRKATGMGNPNAKKEFFAKFGDGEYGHVVDGIFRLQELLIYCFRDPEEIFHCH